MTSPLARIALAELHQRKASVDAAVAAHRFSRSEGERLLRCWLAIALAAGAAPQGGSGPRLAPHTPPPDSTHVTSPLARIALAELHQRKASVDAAVAAHRFSRSEGERLLRCWLAIALAAGAAPQECGALVGYWQDNHGLTDALARHELLRTGPPRAEWLAELARARDAAGRKARTHPTDTSLCWRRHALDSLCIYLGGPAEQQPELAAAA